MNFFAYFFCFFSFAITIVICDVILILWGRGRGREGREREKDRPTKKLANYYTIKEKWRPNRDFIHVFAVAIYIHIEYRVPQLNTHLNFFNYSPPLWNLLLKNKESEHPFHHLRSHTQHPRNSKTFFPQIAEEYCHQHVVFLPHLPL